MNAPKAGREIRVIAENRKARHNYFIEDETEAGIMLVGTEVKSLRAGHANIGDAFAEVRGEEIFLINAHIQEYEFGNRNNHDARRPRKLLLNRREINRIMAAIQRKGYTVVPLNIYFNERGRVKVKIGLAKGKQLHDKRASEKERDWSREKGRLLKDHG
ncbi:SsrA-binding protein SmpB [Govanella unica]|uniref:SsrA-binding protein n=1 Tax=Govanella unica TaxID=2975056 RepID=A0A9X3TYF3_9PROT|nr:SsrA-binding protein SmpB [Govania unica]MDA5194255.1 SsrA-binding protein SmpB [Govania unica]